MTKIGILLLAFVMAAPAAAQRQGRLPIAQGRGPGAAPSSVTVHLPFQGLDRTYLLHAPTRAGSTPAALVLAFHGGSQTAEQMEAMTGFSALADREGFVVAYPQGIDNSWADGRGTTAADKQHVDDVGFASAIVADISRRASINVKQIYATGPSNGGILSNRLGCEMAATLAGIGPVISAIASDVAPRCRPASPIAVVAIQSVSDPLVPFNGGQVGENGRIGAGGRVASARATQDLWRAADGCGSQPGVTTLPVRVNDGTSVVQRQFPGCKGGTDVVWYEIQGGGHRWPPHQATTPAEKIAARLFGVSSQNIDATDTIWQFFKSHPKP
jgi:polyhydroxybutyrate depolymerase